MGTKPPTPISHFLESKGRNHRHHRYARAENPEKQGIQGVTMVEESSPRRRERVGDHTQDLAGSHPDTGSVADPIGSLAQAPTELPTVREAHGIFIGARVVRQDLDGLINQTGQDPTPDSKGSLAYRERSQVDRLTTSFPSGASGPVSRAASDAFSCDAPGCESSTAATGWMSMIRSPLTRTKRTSTPRARMGTIEAARRPEAVLGRKVRRFMS